MHLRKPSKREWGHAAPRPTVDQFATTRERMNRASANFIKLDLKTALIFASMALETENPVKKERNRRAARKAYDTVIRFTQKIALTDAETRDVKRGLEHLREELTKLGEAV